MVIQCTKALLDKLNLEKNELVPAEDDKDDSNGFYSWHAHFISINRRKAIICMNNLTKYTIVLYRPKAKDIAELGEQLKKGIETAFREEGIREEVIAAYMEGCKTCSFSKTAGRSLVANLNKSCEAVSWHAGLLDEESVIQKKISLALGNYLSNFEGNYDYPNERLFRELGKLMGMPENAWDTILGIENYQLKIKISLEKFDIWRRILIPSSCTFHRLHEVIQESFGWFNYHLHEFRVLDESAEGEKLPLYARLVKIRIVDGKDPEVGEYLEPGKYEVRYDTDTRLKDIFKDTAQCLYTYDFGDNWEHLVTLENVIPESANRFPLLLERKGERPPEDVGGEGGFEEYMNVISNKDDPEYERILQWWETSRAEEKTIEEINRRIKR